MLVITSAINNKIYIFFVLVVFFAVLYGCSNRPYPEYPGQKALYLPMLDEVKTFDPVKAASSTSFQLIKQLYDGLFEYDYYRRPYQLVPAIAKGTSVDDIPKVQTKIVDGRSISYYHIAIKQGIYFIDDPCFPNGKGREITAQDVVFSIKRLADVTSGSVNYWLLDGKIVGLDNFHEYTLQAKQDGVSVDYNRKVSGLRVLDRYTLYIELTSPFPQLLYILAMPPAHIHPHEAVTYYNGDDRVSFNLHAVGSGPFILSEYKRSHHIVLKRNPSYRDDYFIPRYGVEKQKAPAVDVVYIPMVTSKNSAFLLLKQGYVDMFLIPRNIFEEVIPDGKHLSLEYSELGLQVQDEILLVTDYIRFNFDDPIVGTNRKLRQALSLAFDYNYLINEYYKGIYIRADGPIPPMIWPFSGELDSYDSLGLKNPFVQTNIEKAKALLSEAGYPGGKAKSGKQLILKYSTLAEPEYLEMARIIAGFFDRIGVKLKVVPVAWTALMDQIITGDYQLSWGGWMGDYPDPENFLLLFDRKRIPHANKTRYADDEYQQLFDELAYLENTEERKQLIIKAIKKLQFDCPWIFKFFRREISLKHNWLKNCYIHMNEGFYWKYYDVDVDERNQFQENHNKPQIWFVFALLGFIILFVLLGLVQKYKRLQNRISL
jgi:oligopeptide transport system substrate-binding protein